VLLRWLLRLGVGACVTDTSKLLKATSQPRDKLLSEFLAPPGKISEQNFISIIHLYLQSLWLESYFLTACCCMLVLREVLLDTLQDVAWWHGKGKASNCPCAGRVTRETKQTYIILRKGNAKRNMTRRAKERKGED
jgi:hypothetical protein